MALHDELKQRTPVRGQGRHAFLARRGEIRRALQDGYSVKEVWALLYEKGAIPVQYRTFIDYVNRYLKNDEQPQTQRTKTPPQPPSKGAKAESKVVKRHGNQLTKRFKFDAKGRSKEDLI